MNIYEQILMVFKLLNIQVIPESGVSPGRGLQILLSYLHPVKCEHNGVQSHHRSCSGWSMLFAVMRMREYKPRVDWHLAIKLVIGDEKILYC